MHAKRVLIASNSFDRYTTMPVIEELVARGVEPVLFEADKVFSGEECFKLSLEDSLYIQYGEYDLSPGTVHAAWYRRPSTIALEREDVTNKAKDLSIAEEVKNLQSAIWQSIPEAQWLNSPVLIKKAEEKIGQLLLAQAIGFDIPQTVVSNSWGEINKQLGSDKVLIMKMPFGLLYDFHKAKAMYTTILTPENRLNLLETSPFPGIFQPFLLKAREWRVTVVGEQVFEASIYSSSRINDDWRKHQASGSVTFKDEALSDGIKQKCVDFLGKLGLKFGTFDFVEDYDGRLTFLECNPNGQYRWIEEMLQLPISKSIAFELVKIAKEHS